MKQYSQPVKPYFVTFYKLFDYIYIMSIAMFGGVGSYNFKMKSLDRVI